MKRLLLPVLLLLFSALPAWAAEEATQPYGLLEMMEDELERSMKNLGHASDVPLYFLQYAVTGLHKLDLEVQDGGLFAPQQEQRRFLDVDLRVGSMELDSTHEIRGTGAGSSFNFSWRRAAFPLENDPEAVRAVLWNETERKYHQAQERFTKVLADRQVMVEEEDRSDDFSPAEARKYSEDETSTPVDLEQWHGLLKKVGTYIAGHPFVRTSGAGLTVEDISTTMVNSEGSRLEHGNHYHRFWLQVQGMAEDGMELRRAEYYSVRSLEGLPGEKAIMADAERLVSELKAFHVQRWIDSYEHLSNGSKRNYCRAIQRAMRWAEQQGYVERSPIAHMEKPAAGKREIVVPQAEFDRILAITRDRAFRDLLITSWETGCRPQESLRVEARHVDLVNNRWVFPESESKTGVPRAVYLTEKSLEITNRLILTHPEGRIFRNTRGRPWTTDAVNCRFTTLQKKLGNRYCLYVLRHTWMNRLLTNGVDSLTVAILAGHADPSTLAKTYQHLSQDPSYLRNALSRAIA